MNRIIFNNKIFTSYEYKTEKEFEQEIINNSQSIFGPNTVYIDVKRKIANNRIVSIPDGYLIDLSFEKDPHLYIIENELAKHDPYKHIGEQLLKFGISYKTSGRIIKKFLLDELTKNKGQERLIEEYMNRSNFRNIDALLEEVIFEKPVAAIVIIDEITPELNNVLKQLTMKIDLLQFQTYLCGNEKIHRYDPFQEEIRLISESKTKKVDIEELNTVIVAARPEGFEKVFLGENCWYAIRISSSMLDRIKYIAAYQVQPVCAITHIAKVARIEKYEESSKYKLFFKEPAEKIDPITLPKGNKGLAPQAPRYTTFKKLLKAKTMRDVL